MRVRALQGPESSFSVSPINDASATADCWIKASTTFGELGTAAPAGAGRLATKGRREKRARTRANCMIVFGAWEKDWGDFLSITRFATHLKYPFLIVQELLWSIGYR